ncbi:LuxR C-terminal-related transcriptional regulator [Streptomyces sp. NBC_00212]|uniref:helix-turn-helix transcriptional regulator n=1 Tax=Streptomyces sp. NBC_00212 TaxID=2975684 RepID=UPI002F917DB0
MLSELAERHRGERGHTVLVSQLDAVEAAIAHTEQLQQRQLTLQQELSRARFALRSALSTEEQKPAARTPDREADNGDVFAQATREVWFSLTLPATAQCLSIAEEQFRLLSAQGVALRAVYPRHVLSDPDAAEHLERSAELGVQMRFAPASPVFTAVIDRRIVFIAAGGEAPHRTEAFFRQADEVALLVEAFEASWAAAAGGSAPAVLLSDEQRSVLRRMRSGMKDDAIARELGISSRTLTRMIATVMDALDARSRFEAGVKAKELGLLH